MDQAGPALRGDAWPSLPYTLHAPAAALVPIVLSSPHSGRVYSPRLMETARLDEATLRRSEDSYVDELFAAGPSSGAPLICADFPRAFCDVNREAWELDPAMFEDALPDWVNTTSPRVGAGLGTIARVVANGEGILGTRLRFEEAERRVRLYWHPYHDALAGLIARARERFGFCLLLDCHSMPALVPKGREKRVEIVLGDAHGAACGAAIVGEVERFLAQDCGYMVRRNDPYAGGYVTRHYGQPRGGVHALQIELARDLYMDEATLRRGPGFGVLHDHLGGLVARLAAVAPSLMAGHPPAG